MGTYITLHQPNVSFHHDEPEGGMICGFDPVWEHHLTCAWVGRIYAACGAVVQHEMGGTLFVDPPWHRSRR